MGQVRHGSATTTHAVRAAIQRSQASLAQLSRELGINPTTVAKWRKRAKAFLDVFAPVFEEYQKRIGF